MAYSMACSTTFSGQPVLLGDSHRQQLAVSWKQTHSGWHQRQALRVTRAAYEKDRSRKGKSYESKKRRRGRPEWLRSPDDTPLRDGNRDRVIGLLTLRATRTLAYYLSELNPNVYHWLVVFLRENPIPTEGVWDDVSGETFLRKLLSMPIESAKYNTGRGAMYDCNPGCGVDPRNIAQRIMEIRSVIAKEMIQDLSEVSEENSALMRETIQLSFSLNIDNVTSHPVDDADTVDSKSTPRTVADAKVVDPKSTPRAVADAETATVEPKPTPSPVADAETVDPKPIPSPGADAETMEPKPTLHTIADAEIVEAKPTPSPVADAETVKPKPTPSPVADAGTVELKPTPRTVADVETETVEPKPTPHTIADAETVEAKPTPSSVADAETETVEPKPTPHTVADAEIMEPKSTPHTVANAETVEPKPTPSPVVEAAEPKPTPHAIDDAGTVDPKP